MNAEVLSCDTRPNGGTPYNGWDAGSTSIMTTRHLIYRSWSHVGGHSVNCSRRGWCTAVYVLCHTLQDARHLYRILKRDKTTEKSAIRQVRLAACQVFYHLPMPSSYYIISSRGRSQNIATCMDDHPLDIALESCPLRSSRLHLHQNTRPRSRSEFHTT